MPGYNSGQTSVLDTITRTYRNGAGDIIATQTISVLARSINSLDARGAFLTTSTGLSPNRFRRTARITLATTLSPKSGASTTIATVTTEGRFDSRTENGGDIVSVVYSGTENVNDLEVPVNGLNGVFQIGGVV